jgi:1-acyl-sn-glycerol-3-phosphate acyltransferase
VFLIHRFDRFVVRLFFRIFTRWRIIGRGNIPLTGPLLVVANHMTYAEAPMLYALIKRDTRFATKEGFFRNKIIGKFFEIHGGFPVYPGRIDIKSVRSMERFLVRGLAVAIFPEGTRSVKRYSLLPGSRGVALIAHRTGAPILPIGITGTEKMRGFIWFFKRPIITIKFGEPFYLPPEDGKLDKEAATRYIMERIAEQLPPEYHGSYARQDEK